MRRLLTLLLLLLLLGGCSDSSGPLDLEALSAQAKGGSATAFRTLVELLARQEGDVNGRAYGILLECGSASIPYLLEKVADGVAERREHVIAALGTLKAVEAVPSIGAVLQQTDLSRRYVAAWALGEIGHASAVPYLIPGLADRDSEVQKRATRSLIKLNRAAVSPLLEYLSKAPPLGAAAAIRALGDIGDPRALPALLGQLDSVNRREVYHALGKLKDPRAEQGLIDGLADADWRNRMAAATALGPVGGPAAAGALRGTLEDEIPVVREWAARSLEMITGERTLYRNSRGEMSIPYQVYH